MDRLCDNCQSDFAIQRRGISQNRFERQPLSGRPIINMKLAFFKNRSSSILTHFAVSNEALKK